MIKSIKFNKTGVNAIKYGKTVTRRPVGKQDIYDIYKGIPASRRYGDLACKYGDVGDRLFIQESFNVDSRIIGNISPYSKITYEADYNDPRRTFLHAGFMVQEESRYDIIIESIRCERLNDITPEDCIKEGIYTVDHAGKYYDYLNEDDTCKDMRSSFFSLWNSIYNEREGDNILTSSKNPFVWRIEFKTINKAVMA